MWAVVMVPFITSMHSGHEHMIGQHRDTRTQTTAPGILLKNVGLILDTHTVFTDLTLSLAAAQWHCILGRSGVGKSSLLRLLSGLQAPTTGTVTTHDHGTLSEHVSHLSQDDGLLPWLNILDNVQLGPRLRGTRTHTSRERALDLLNRVGLGDWVSSLPERLSGGMRQRVALARTLLEGRSVVLMDEPFSRLDAITRQELQSLAFKLLEHRTVVLVTHDPLEALRLGHTVTVLNRTGEACAHTRVLPTEPLRAVDDTVLTEQLPELWRALQCTQSTDHLVA